MGLTVAMLIYSQLMILVWELLPLGAKLRILAPETH